MTAMSYAELKAIASGNPLVMEKAVVDGTVQKLGMAYNQWEQDRWRLGHRKVTLQQRLDWISGNMDLIEQDAKLAAATSSASTFKALTQSAGKASQGASGTAEAIGQAFRMQSSLKQEGVFAEVNGFQLAASRSYLGTELQVVTPKSGLRATVNRPNLNDVTGVGIAALETIAGIAGDPAKLREEFCRKTEELASVETMLTEDFEHREALATARARQAEIEAKLDLDKSTAGSQAMDTESA